MENYVLFTESTCDLTPDLVREMDVQVLPMTFTLDGQCYRNYPDNRELAPKAFYDKLRNGSMSTTSQVAISDYEEAFTPFLEAGKDILYLAFSSGLSGTYQASKVAIEELQEKFPGRRIVSIDSLQASMGEGLFAYTLAMMRKEGATMDALIDYAEKNTQRFCAWFTVSDLMFLKRGGRLSGAAAVAGTLLGIKPVLHVDAEGHLIAMEKVRGRRASLDALVKHFAATADKNYGEMTVFVSHGDCLEDAQYVADKVKAYGVHRICIGDIGPVIGAHSGPGTVALFFLGGPR
ncbi:DegV family protein [uncultured Subdoligranulum sp.]|uniref:DegV family protein n=1 Tax=uncultured Subdoligranulum sp. TaxID=512298 RepID=UPI0025F066F5|nr:DegV family protein [uncultured Subdoligranulum sp.]